MNDFLVTCANILDVGTDAVSGDLPDNGRDFLVDLQFIDQEGRIQGEETQKKHNVKMLRAAACLERLFPLKALHAPNLVILGGEANPAILGEHDFGSSAGSVSGCGLSFREAFLSCVGEGVEFLSQFEQEDDLTQDCDAGHRAILPEDIMSVSLETPGSDWVAGWDLHLGEPVLLPAGRCLRRKTEQPLPFALGTGCGAGETTQDALLHGLLELVERDAVAIWWQGGKFGCSIDTGHPAARAASDRLCALRGGEQARVSWLLDISTDLEIPCVASVSCDRNGGQVACGTAAGTTLLDAARSAVLEMCQMEIAYDVVEAKLSQRGEAALNEVDRRHIARGRDLNANSCSLLHPEGIPISHRESVASNAEDKVRWVLEAMADNQQPVFAVELTRPQFDVPAARVVAPGLQLAPSTIVTPRLTAATDRYGGGETHTNSISLH